MTKRELIDALATRAELSKANAELIVNLVFATMAQALQRGDAIELRGFGSFTLRRYRAYSGRNPRTGDHVEVSAKRLPYFKVGKGLRELVDASRDQPITDGRGEDDGRDG